MTYNWKFMIEWSSNHQTKHSQRSSKNASFCNDCHQLGRGSAVSVV